MKRLIASVLTVVLALALVSCGNTQKTTKVEDDTQSAAKTEVISYNEFVLAEDGTEVCLDLYIMAHQAWYNGKVSIYACDANDNGYFLYEVECAEQDVDKLTEGLKIRVSGTKSEYSGESEVSNATFEIIDDGDTHIASPVVINQDNIASFGDFVDVMNQKARLEGVTIASTSDVDGVESVYQYKWDGSGSEGDDLYFTGIIGSKTISFTVESDLYGADSEVYQAIKALSIGDVINIDCYLYFYQGVQPHVTGITVVE